jgi:hypothetical protein
MTEPAGRNESEDIRQPPWARLRRFLSPGRALMALVVLASLGMLAYGLVSNWRELVTYEWRITYWPLVAALLLYPAALGIAVLIWHQILQHLGGHSRWQQDLRIYCVSNIARRLPTPAWFVAGRIYLGSQINLAKSVSSMGVLLEAVLILVSGLLLSVLTLPFGSQGGPLGQHGPKLVPLLLLGLVLIIRPQLLRAFIVRLARWLGRGQSIPGEIDYRRMVMWTGLYAVVWILGGITLYLLVRTVYPLPAGSLPTVIGIWAIGGVVSHLAVFTPGGLGIKELTMAALLSSLVPMTIAIVVSIGARVWYSLNELFWFALTSPLSSTIAPVPQPNGRDNGYPGEQGSPDTTQSG